MDVFDLRESLIEQYQSFARSFTAIKAEDIRLQIEQAYDSGPLALAGSAIALMMRSDQPRR